MSVTALRGALVLSAWSVFVWTTRIRNIWTDDSLTTAGQWWRTALSLAFTVFAVVTIGIWVRARRDGRTPWTHAGAWIRAFALWTCGVWAVRTVQITTADHEVAFKVVHAVLGIVSVGLAVWADRSANRSVTAARVSV